MTHKKWLEQPLDHFNPKDNRTFKMRYAERTTFWKEGGPIYLYLCQSPEIDIFFSGPIFELAQETNGALFLAVQRYMYDSKPFKEDYTPENLKFNTIRQALADFANLLNHIKSSPNFASSKVVVVGLLKWASMAAWMRLVYPDLVDAAYASSAPVLAKADFFEFYESTGDLFKKYGSPGCYDRIADRFAYYEKAFQSKEGTDALKKDENICDSCDMNKPLNQVMFLDVKASHFAAVAFGAVNVSDFKEYCDKNFTSIRKMRRPGQNRDGKDNCWCPDFDEMMDFYKKWQERYAVLYQSCHGLFGYFTTGSSDKQPFSKRVSTDYFYKICEELYGPDFNANRIKKTVEESNIRYGGLTPNVSKVVFVNGELDPFIKLSILQDLSPDAPAIVISQETRCADFDSTKDSEELKKARARIKSLIKGWIGVGESNKESLTIA